ncbi:hypothetical protein NQ318_000612 [Aromia moschata]|uniref:Uncharacterized protein n=1 Tax=Aromia moschata TaxID=1265417 RepID=A0AAV8XPK9_9CUCU|nr:hypothetical protein NQ318_000612 [Aromia moschata]
MKNAERELNMYTYFVFSLQEELLDSLKDKHEKTVKDLKEIEKALRDIAQKRSVLHNLKDDVIEFYVFGENLSQTEEDLKNLKLKVDNEVRDAKQFSAKLRSNYNKTQQLVPSDVAQELNQLELLAGSDR